MSDHLGPWWCRYCHYKASSLYLWKKHLVNFHDGIDPRDREYVEPASESVVCWICENEEHSRRAVCPNIACLVEHIENVHYGPLDHVHWPVVWNDRIVAGFVNLLAFEDYYRGREAA